MANGQNPNSNPTREQFLYSISKKNFENADSGDKLSAEMLTRSTLGNFYSVVDENAIFSNFDKELFYKKMVHPELKKVLNQYNSTIDEYRLIRAEADKLETTNPTAASKLLQSANEIHITAMKTASAFTDLEGIMSQIYRDE